MIYAVNGATYGDAEKAAESFMGLREEEKEMMRGMSICSHVLITQGMKKTPTPWS